jgi:hypothetical protein
MRKKLALDARQPRNNRTHPNAFGVLAHMIAVRHAGLVRPACESRAVHCMQLVHTVLGCCQAPPPAESRRVRPSMYYARCCCCCFIATLMLARLHVATAVLLLLAHIPACIACRWVASFVRSVRVEVQCSHHTRHTARVPPSCGPTTRQSATTTFAAWSQISSMTRVVERRSHWCAVVNADSIKHRRCTCV